MVLLQSNIEVLVNAQRFLVELCELEFAARRTAKHVTRIIESDYEEAQFQVCSETSGIGSSQTGSLEQPRFAGIPKRIPARN
jgi:hypothetical protein